MNLLLVIVDSLRWDYSEGLIDAMNPADVYKCHVHGETTSLSLPQILTGIYNPDAEVIDSVHTRNGAMWLTRINTPTIFDYFPDHYRHYINVGRDEPMLYSRHQSFFPSLPSGQTLAKAMTMQPYCVVLHIWDVHYPHPEGYNHYVEKFVEKRVPTLKQFKDTLIVLTADHGECLGEDGRHGHRPPMTRELREVPLVFYPAERHKVHNTVAHSTQILPTILDVFGLEHSLGGSLIE